MIFEMSPNIGKLYIISKKILPQLRIRDHYPQITTDWSKLSFKSSDCMKNEKFFRLLSTVDLGVDGKLNSRAIEWKWNHDDPTVGSPKNRGPPNSVSTPPTMTA